MRAVYCSGLFLLLSLVGYSQPSEPASYFEGYAHPQKSRLFTAIGIGFTGYDGTIALLTEAENQNSYLNPQLSVDVGYQLTNYLAVIARANYLRLNLTNDRNQQEIFSNNLEGIALLRHYVFSQQAHDEYLRKFNYYGFAGLGGLYFKPRNKATSEPLPPSSDAEQLSLVIPLGVGVEYRLSNFFSMALEASYHFSQSDYLDGKAGPNVNGRQGNDRLALFNARINYRIPRKHYDYPELLKLKNKGRKQ